MNRKQAVRQIIDILIGQSQIDFGWQAEAILDLLLPRITTVVEFDALELPHKTVLIDKTEQVWQVWRNERVVLIAPANRRTPNFPVSTVVEKNGPLTVVWQPEVTS